MKYYVLDPEVAGGLGERTSMDSSVHPPIVTRLHYEIDGWLGDDLVQSFPCYLVTNGLRERLATIQPTGVSFAPADVSASEDFKSMHPSAPLPKLVWIKIHGVPARDDFGLTADARLVVSDRVLSVLNAGRIEHCDVKNSFV